MKKLLGLIVSFLLIGSVNAFAFPLWNGSGTTAGTLFEDNDLDYFLNLVGDADVIDVGDVMYSAIEFDGLKQLPFGDTYDLSANDDELVAIAAIQLKGYTYDGNGDISSWIFGEYDDGDATTDDSMVKFYTGGAINFKINSNPTWAAAYAAITDGTFLWSFSVNDSDEDTFWVFNPLDPNADSISFVQGTSQSTKIGSLNYALVQTGGVDIFGSVRLDAVKTALASDYDGVTGDGLVDMTGSGDILGADGLTHAFATSDIDSAVNPIPEPATLTLLGFGLLSLAYGSRRSRR